MLAISSIFIDDLASHVVGNTIYLPEADAERNANGELEIKELELETFGHGVAHVWQNQNGGGDYAHQAIIDMVQAASAPGGSHNDAYNGVEQLNAGVKFEHLTPEQQAGVAQEIGVILDNAGTLPPEFSDAHDSIVKGEGAP